MNRKAIIFGIKGYKLNKREKLLFRKYKPWGAILFSRNIKNLYQLKKLVADIKSIFNERDYPILIDVEGGKVSRINKIMDLSIFSQSYFGELYKKKRNSFFYQYQIYINSVSSILKEVGINVNTVPVLDLKHNNAHNIIGSRSFSRHAKNVSYLGKTCVALYSKNKIATVTKHIPGHGLAKSDSHHNTPLINQSLKRLKKNDFKPFKECKSQFAMTAHVIYKNIDSNNTVTHSKKLIKNIIRKEFNFRGILISDDISMKSLKFSLETNAVRALDSGCNLVLHCNGNIKEMNKLIKVIPKIDKFTSKKTSQFLRFLG